MKLGLLRGREGSLTALVRIQSKHLHHHLHMAVSRTFRQHVLVWFWPGVASGGQGVHHYITQPPGGDDGTSISCVCIWSWPPLEKAKLKVVFILAKVLGAETAFYSLLKVCRAERCKILLSHMACPKLQSQFQRSIKLFIYKT